jgi:hypothetical protein
MKMEEGRELDRGLLPLRRLMAGRSIPGVCVRPAGVEHFRLAGLDHPVPVVRVAGDEAEDELAEQRERRRDDDREGYPETFILTRHKSSSEG